MRDRTRFVTRAGVIAALYVVLTLAPGLSAIAYGPIQVRVSEALTALAFFEPAAIPGLWIGAVISNYFGPNGIWDVAWGASLTLVAAYLTWKIRKPALALLPPVLINAFGVAFLLKYLVAFNIPDAYAFLVFSVGGGEVIAVYLIGYPILMYLLNTGILIRQEVFAAKMGRPV